MRFHHLFSSLSGGQDQKQKLTAFARGPFRQLIENLDKLRAAWAHLNNFAGNKPMIFQLSRIDGKHRNLKLYLIFAIDLI